MSALAQPLRRTWPNLLIISYTLFGWGLGIYLLTSVQPVWNVIGVLLTAHTLIYSGYLIHECVHHTALASLQANDRLGMLLSWLNGACLADYQRLKKKHLRHHADRLDVVTFDYRAALRASPAWIQRAVLALEWAYVPAVELMMRGLIIAFPFHDGTADDRVRVLALLAIRALFFAGLAVISIKAVLLYALSYLLFLHVLRFLDAFQHTYEVFPSGPLRQRPLIRGAPGNTSMRIHTRTC
jgi:fatty acid desaturase